jgi:hypothetical protein
MGKMFCRDTLSMTTPDPFAGSDGGEQTPAVLGDWPVT